MQSAQLYHIRTSSSHLCSAPSGGVVCLNQAVTTPPRHGPNKEARVKPNGTRKSRTAFRVSHLVGRTAIRAVCWIFRLAYEGSSSAVRRPHLNLSWVHGYGSPRTRGNGNMRWASQTSFCITPKRKVYPSSTLLQHHVIMWVGAVFREPRLSKAPQGKAASVSAPALDHSCYNKTVKKQM